MRRHRLLALAFTRLGMEPATACEQAARCEDRIPRDVVNTICARSATRRGRAAASHRPRPAAAAPGREGVRPPMSAPTAASSIPDPNLITLLCRARGLGRPPPRSPGQGWRARLARPVRHPRRNRSGCSAGLGRHGRRLQAGRAAAPRAPPLVPDPDALRPLLGRLARLGGAGRAPVLVAGGVALTTGGVLLIVTLLARALARSPSRWSVLMTTRYVHLAGTGPARSCPPR